MAQPLDSEQVVPTFGAETGKTMAHSIESVGQVLGVRSEDKSRLELTRQCVEPRHPAKRWYRCHWDAEAGVPYSTEGKFVVWTNVDVCWCPEMQKASS